MPEDGQTARRSTANGEALRLIRSGERGEMLARRLELELGETLQPSTHVARTVELLREHGLHDLAERTAQGPVAEKGLRPSKAESDGVATFTTAALTLGSHSITATFAGTAQFSGSASPVLVQGVQTPADSVKLRALQVLATKAIAQNSGAAISSAIDNAIAEGFSDGGAFMTPTATGVRFNLAGDWSQAGANQNYSGPGAGQHESAAPLPGNAFAPQEESSRPSRVDRVFANLDRNRPTFARVQNRIMSDWLLWADVKTSGLRRPDSVVGNLSMLHGNQVNALVGLTYRITPDLLVGAVGGWETFNYTSEALSGRMKGDGWTIGSYLGWRIGPQLRFDAASTYSLLSYDGSAGTARGSFQGNRLLLSAGLTGSLKLAAFELEPSARIFGLWEQQNSYTDSLGTRQDRHTFFTGRASAGMRLVYPWEYNAKITFAPYVGLYADTYFNSDDTASNTAALQSTSVPILDGLSARVTAGITTRYTNGSSLSLDGEYGGIGGNGKIWTMRARAATTF